MKKIYVSPSAKPGVGYKNKYFNHLKTSLASYFEVLEADNKPCLAQGLALLINSFKADVFLLSFVETIAFQKLAFIQYCLACMALFVMRLRKKQIIFIFHNIKPHKGENFMSRSLTRLQMKMAKKIISHSERAVIYAKDYLRSIDENPDKVLYICHPVTKFDFPEITQKDNRKCIDILIWGDIFPYKGVPEFLNNPLARGLKIHIVGYAKDAKMAEKMLQSVKCYNEKMAGKVQFENRRASYEEITILCSKSKCVLFPYKPESVSGSGLLIDTIVLGGMPAGPRVGAFKDLSKKGLCYAYNDVSEVIEIIKDGKTPLLENMSINREKFIKENSWEKFAETIFNSVC